MASDEATPSGDEGQARGGRPGFKFCPFPEGNDTRFPYQLSIHGAWMLASGIRDYARQARQMHEAGEDASYCLLMTRTAAEQARRLRAWARRAAPDYLEGTIRELGELLAELAEQEDSFKAVACVEGTGRAKSGPH